VAETGVENETLKRAGRANALENFRHEFDLMLCSSPG